MATVKKNKSGDYEFNVMINGKRYHYSYKGLSKKEVEDKLAELRTHLKYDTPFSNKKPKHKLSELIADYKEFRKIHYTRPEEFDYVIDRFFKIIGDVDVETITPSDIEKYISSRLEKVKNSTINREMDNIRRVFSLGLENYKISFNPCNNIKKLRIENPPVRILTKEEEIALLKECHTNLKVMIITMLHTGIRQSELLNLKWEDIFFDENYFIGRDTKNNKVHLYPLMPNLKKELLSVPQISEYVFTSPSTLTKYSDIKSSFRRAVERSGIPYINLHKLRNTAASRMNEAGVDAFTIQKVLDHSDLKTTMRYIHTPNASIYNAFKILDGY